MRQVIVISDQNKNKDQHLISFNSCFKNLLFLVQKFFDKKLQTLNAFTQQFLIFLLSEGEDLFETVHLGKFLINYFIQTLLIQGCHGLLSYTKLGRNLVSQQQSLFLPSKPTESSSIRFLTSFFPPFLFATIWNNLELQSFSLTHVTQAF